MNYIPYGKQTIEDDDIDAVIAVLRSDFLTTGPKVEEFEKKLCEVTGAKFAVAVSNGTSALCIALASLGLKHGDEVILPPLTFAASSNAVLYCDATPVFADIDSETMLLDLESVKSKINKNTKVIMPVHYGGELCNMAELQKIADEFDLTIVQDCAHSLGGRTNNKKLGEFDGLQTWSFHPVKTITTGEGGAITTNDKELYERLVLFRSHGITRDPQKLTNQQVGSWYYEMQALSYNYRITDIQCALGTSQLKKLPKFAKRRSEIVKKYDTAFAGLPIKLQKSPETSNPVRHLYTIRLKSSDERFSVFNKLKAAKIGVNVHYIPVYLLPYYQEVGYCKGLCPNAETAYDTLLTLPLYPLLTDEEVNYVIEKVKESIS